MQRPFVEKVKQNKAIETKRDKLLIAVKRYMYCQNSWKETSKGLKPTNESCTIEFIPS